MTEQLCCHTGAPTRSGSSPASQPSVPASARIDPAGLDIRTVSVGLSSLLEPSGALTAATCDGLLQTVDLALDPGVRSIVLDLRGVRTIDDTGARALLIAHLRASDQLAELRLVPGQPVVQRAVDRLQAAFAYVDADPS